MKNRHGYSLIEMLVAIGLISTTFTIVIVSLHGMHRADQRIHEELRHESDWHRFAGQFREDGHRAQSVQPGEQMALVFTWTGDQQVEYRLRGHRVERVERRQGEVRHQETYTLPTTLQAQWQIATDTERPLASLVLVPEPARATGPFAPRSVRVDCVVGLFAPPIQPSSP